MAVTAQTPQPQMGLTFEQVWATILPVLQKSDEIEELAAIYQKLLAIPDRAKADCSQLAACVLAHIDYLLSWNCKHLGPVSYVKVREYNDTRGLWTPVLVTPESLVSFNEEEL
jgi:hypothetical protein